MSEVRIAAEPRTEFGKGAARRARRAGKVPAVLYGHGTAPLHLNLPGHDLMLALKTPNVLLRLEGIETDNTLVLPKSVQRDAIKGFLEHVDLLAVQRGEQVVVEVPLVPQGEVASGGVLNLELAQIEVRAEATHLPEGIEVDVAGLEVGTSITAGELKLPAGVELAADADTIVVSVVAEAAPETPAEAEESAAE
ncbi:50S ribosomal protein L25/general stress protein Ctc [Thermobifida cellulosilytica]|uniref:Large ribosomal subunit protein bL25 n=1 Tax=Thermobifida cellulosilytica TB100 TaxID=665004 RepID=A0A147KJU2_THECS|nr:50S ribosomal protein L25/general stress protein Ctc [Thermobifida cellulosilytica]KUP97566.1 50S ribosomal protein L25 [Thermobifida cellulosilytica TB100]